MSTTLTIIASVAASFVLERAYNFINVRLTNKYEMKLQKETYPKWLKGELSDYHIADLIKKRKLPE